MSTEIEERIQSELSSQERLLWSGVPQQGLVLHGMDWYVIPFSVFWSGILMFMVSKSFSVHEPAIFRLFLLPFVLVAIYLLAGRFYLDAWRRSRTWYAVTDARVIILTHGTSRSIKSVSLKGLAEIALETRSDRRGNILFGMMLPNYARWSTGIWPGASARMPPTFERIEDARAVYDLILAARDRVSSPESGRRNSPGGLPDLDSRGI